MIFDRIFQNGQILFILHLLLFSFHLLQTLSEPEVDKLIDGIAVHWYGDRGVDPNKLSITKERHPRQFILATEVQYSHSNPRAHHHPSNSGLHY